MKKNTWPEWVSMFHGLVIMGLIAAGWHLATKLHDRLEHGAKSKKS